MDNQTNPPPLKTAAFSLIELMIVIAIIAILSSFAIPVVASTPWQTPYGAHADQLYTIRTLQAPPTGSYATRRRVAGALTLLGPIKADIINNASNGLPFAANVNLTPPNPAKTKITALAIDPTIGLITVTFSPSLTPYNIASTLLQGTPTSSTIPDGSPWWCPWQLPGQTAFSGVPLPPMGVTFAAHIHWSSRSADVYLKYGGWDYVSGTIPGKYAPTTCNESPWS